MRNSLSKQRQQNIVYSIPCSECPNAYVAQTGHQFATRMKEHRSAVRRQDENSLLPLHCLTTGHAFHWTRALVVGNGPTERTREFTEAWNTTKTGGNQCMTIDPCFKALGKLTQPGETTRPNKKLPVKSLNKRTLSALDKRLVHQSTLARE